jgi:hypothetical protein
MTRSSLLNTDDVGGRRISLSGRLSSKRRGADHLGDLLFAAAAVLVMSALATLMWSTATATFFP